MGNNIVYGIQKHSLEKFKAFFMLHRNITLFGYSLIANFLLRLAMYIVCGVVMSGYSTRYIEVKP